MKLELQTTIPDLQPEAAQGAPKVTKGDASGGESFAEVLERSAGTDPAQPEILRGLQRAAGLDPTGKLDAATLAHLDRIATDAGVAPAKEAEAGKAGATLVRFQTARGLEPTGVIDRATLDELGRLGRPATLRPAADPRAAALRDSMLRATGAPSVDADAVLLRGVAREHRQIFELAAAANRLVESGDHARFSSLRTTAGPDARASFGTGQLTIREHLTQLAGLEDRDLAAMGVERSAIDAMRRRGDAAEFWYRLLVGAELDLETFERHGVSPSEAVGAHELVEQGRYAALERRFGERFAAGTGLEAREIGALARTAILQRDDLREAFRAQYELDHGVPFDPSSRDPRAMAATARRVAEAHPELGPVLESLGGPERGASSLGHYLGVGDTPENLHGWYARAAEGAVGRSRFVELLRVADPITTRVRHAWNVERALSAVAGAGDLTGLERARVVARIARCFHGAPGRARDFFFEGGDLSRPRFTDRAQLLEGLDGYVDGRSWSDARLVQAFDGEARRRGLV